MAYGLSNMVSAFFASPTSSASMSRSLVGERVGGKTQVTTNIQCYKGIFLNMCCCFFSIVVVFVFFVFCFHSLSRDHFL